MSETSGILLPYAVDIGHGCNVTNHLQMGKIIAAFQFFLQLETDIEMVFDASFVTVRYDQYFYDLVCGRSAGSISFGTAFVAGRKRVPNPAAGMIAFLSFFIVSSILCMLKAEMLQTSLYG